MWWHAAGVGWGGNGCPCPHTRPSPTLPPTLCEVLFVKVKEVMLDLWWGTPTQAAKITQWRRPGDNISRGDATPARRVGSASSQS